MDARPIADVLQGSSFMDDYIPRHCAAHGLDPGAFMDPASEPEPAVCPHCGNLLHYPRIELPNGTWRWRPISKLDPRNWTRAKQGMCSFT